MNEIILKDNNLLIVFYALADFAPMMKIKFELELEIIKACLKKY